MTALFVEEAEIVLSNTGDTGYAIDPADRGPGLIAAHPPVSFPGKLTQLLYAAGRRAGGRSRCCPANSSNRNGRCSRASSSTSPARQACRGAFSAWLRESTIFTDTLVDRIVSEPIEPVGAVAEPYALWAIERRPGLVVPCEHPCIVLADDLEPYERLKLHILNLGHTFLAEIWQREGGLPPRDRARDPGRTGDPGPARRALSRRGRCRASRPRDGAASERLRRRHPRPVPESVSQPPHRRHRPEPRPEDRAAGRRLPGLGRGGGTSLPAPVLRALAAAYPTPGAA